MRKRRKQLKKQLKSDKADCFADVGHSDLELLKEPKFVIPPRVIDYMLQHFLKKALKRYPKDSRWGKHLRNTLIVSHNFYAKISKDTHVDRELPNYSTSKDVHGHLADPWFYASIIFPCFVKGCHWILVVWNFPRNFPYVRIYDSIHNPEQYGDPAWACIENYFWDQVLKANSSRDEALKIWTERAEPKRLPKGMADNLIHENWDKVPTQRHDYHNCGFYVIEMGKNILYKRNPKDYYNAPKKPKIDWNPYDNDRDPTPEEEAQIAAYDKKYKDFHHHIEAKKVYWESKLRWMDW
jgi:hypothetical protein